MAALERFRDGQRVRVIAKGPLCGKTGTVVRRRMADNGAWVNMDDDLPGKFVSFPDKNDSRHRDVMLYPDQCEGE